MPYTKKTNTEEKTVKTTATKTEKTEKVEKPVEIVTTREYKSDDLIPCRSMTKGELVYTGKKSGEIYTWEDYGDITEVEYQDLLGLKAKKSAFIFETLFVIEDEELLEDPKWKDVKALYEKIYSEDVDTLIDMNLNDFKRVFPTLPNGLQRAVSAEVATQMEAGTFDSLQKIKVIDEVCGTDLSSIL